VSDLVPDPGIFAENLYWNISAWLGRWTSSGGKLYVSHYKHLSSRNRKCSARDGDAIHAITALKVNELTRGLPNMSGRSSANILRRHGVRGGILNSDGRTGAAYASGQHDGKDAQAKHGN
jgi:hypothetical protein